MGVGVVCWNRYSQIIYAKLFDLTTLSYFEDFELTVDLQRYDIISNH